MYFVTNIICLFHAHTTLLATTLAHVHNNNLHPLNSMTFNIKKSSKKILILQLSHLGLHININKECFPFFKDEFKGLQLLEILSQNFP